MAAQYGKSNAAGHGGGAPDARRYDQAYRTLNADRALPLKEMIVTSGAWVALIDRDFSHASTRHHFGNTSLQKSCK